MQVFNTDILRIYPALNSFQIITQKNRKGNLKKAGSLENKGFVEYVDNVDKMVDRIT